MTLPLLQRKIRHAVGADLFAILQAQPLSE
jgi:hypothetical protein